ncbi:hypothetical protein WNY58_03680 [Neptuniibacter pectenicola]|uniref:TIGR03016 family PEP-CTERM system-associated outer membrane protein n=1 Tax=Neptuniibacter pectenicola TaxID=1806669 RepID=A0ABU9TPN1_9GAMM|nr:hypothetical protein [Neptuniibacter pectenicola]
MGAKITPRYWLLITILCTFPRYLYAADDWGDDAWGEEEKQGTAIHGFIETAVGDRVSDDTLVDDALSLAEVRARLEAETYQGALRLSGKVDLYADGVERGFDIYLREAVAEFSLTDNVDVRAGHQVLTWGTGDLLFLNDLFAKDWVSFFSGRDDEYLKAPSSSIKVSAYGETANIDFVWTPVFNSDNFISGERFSYFSPQTGTQVAAPSGKIVPDEPSETFSHGEFSARIYGRSHLLGRSSTEWALYGYRGFWKQPNGINSNNQAYFSPLTSLGASLRTNVASGIGHTELAWYNSVDDDGSNPLIPNSQIRFLMGYEQELVPKLTLGVQYYFEHILDYDALSAHDGGSIYRPDEHRELWTMRLSYRALQDNLTFNWFSFYSPTDQDYYHRPSVKYRFNDQVNLTLGGNVFGGKQKQTFFGQFEDASNLYARLRWSY